MVESCFVLDCHRKQSRLENFILSYLADADFFWFQKLAGASLLVFANKQDLAGSMTSDEIKEVCTVMNKCTIMMRSCAYVYVCTSRCACVHDMHTVSHMQAHINIKPIIASFRSWAFVRAHNHSCSCTYMYVYVCMYNIYIYICIYIYSSCFTCVGYHFDRSIYSLF